MTVFRKSNATAQVSAGTNNGLPEFVLSDATTDRYGDVVVPAGIGLTQFKANPIALFNHNPDFPIGKWISPRIVDGQLRAFLQMLRGTSARIDELIALVEKKVLTAVSIGFLPEESEDIRNGGKRYTKTTLVEASLVSIPANPNALAVAKSLNISTGTLNMAFRKTADGLTLAERQQRAREVLARARKILDAPTPRSRTYIPARRDDDLYDGLSAEDIAAIEIAQRKADHKAVADQYAHHQSESLGGEPPKQLFNIYGEPLYRRRNKYGW
jgi:HK97 family phage prohead protease